MEKIVSLCKRRGFVFPSSEIYGGVSALWDYGPLGSLMKNNIKNFWIRRFVHEKENVVLIDGTVLMHPKVWEASGHLKNFTDPLIECKNCHSRFRMDHLEKMECKKCGSKDFTEQKMFNLMFKTFLGPVEDGASQIYLRPETAQSMFVDFKQAQESSRQKIPFGIAQVGKCFRNEITTGDFTFRSREFDIAEIEFFVKPGEDEKWFDFWLLEWERFFVDLGLKKENMRRLEHKKEKLAHYSKRTVDIEYKFPFGWAELAGVANRTDFDLSQHSKFSGKDLSVFDEEEKKNYTPYVIEPTMGIDRLFLALISNAYEEKSGGRTETTESTKEMEIILDLSEKISPIKIAVFPLLKNKDELVKKAKEIYAVLKPYFSVQYDETGSIGRRYRRQDEIGTPFCITVDFDTLNNNEITIRDRKTMQQERVGVDNLVQFFRQKIDL